jgi:hypothetical protein
MVTVAVGIDVSSTQSFPTFSCVLYVHAAVVGVVARLPIFKQSGLPGVVFGRRTELQVLMVPVGMTGHWLTSGALSQAKPLSVTTQTGVL